MSWRNSLKVLFSAGSGDDEPEMPSDRRRKSLLSNIPYSSSVSTEGSDVPSPDNVTVLSYVKTTNELSPEPSVMLRRSSEHDLQRLRSSKSVSVSKSWGSSRGSYDLTQAPDDKRQHRPSGSSTANDAEDSEDDDDPDDDDGDEDDITIAPSLGQSTLTLCIDDGSCLAEDSVAGRLAKIFHDDLEDIVSIIKDMPDSPRKLRFIQQTLHDLKVLRTEVTINSHFLILSLFSNSQRTN